MMSCVGWGEPGWVWVPERKQQGSEHLLKEVDQCQGDYNNLCIHDLNEVGHHESV